MNVNNLLQFFRAEEEIKLCRVNIQNSNGVFNMYNKKAPIPTLKKLFIFFILNFSLFFEYTEY